MRWALKLNQLAPGPGGLFTSRYGEAGTARGLRRGRGRRCGGGEGSAGGRAPGWWEVVSVGVVVSKVGKWYDPSGWQPGGSEVIARLPPRRVVGCIAFELQGGRSNCTQTLLSIVLLVTARCGRSRAGPYLSRRPSVCVVAVRSPTSSRERAGGGAPVGSGRGSPGNGAR